MSSSGLAAAAAKMRAANVSEPAINAFTRLYRLAESGTADYIREADVDPLGDIVDAQELDVSPTVASDALAKTAVIKLNGGLGTSMGVDRAKSLLPVRLDGPNNSLSFLDLTARQLLAARAATGARLPLVLMNSFRTADDSTVALQAYPKLPIAGVPQGFMQSQEPKLRQDDLTPVQWPADPELEWCPPGHGDIYPALHAHDVVKALLDAGFRYASVSNVDNLGAVPDAQLAGWFADAEVPYAAEMSLKTAADIKGGQLVVRKADGQIVQREIAQTHPDDVEAALDPNRHKYFHTNNLWFDLAALAEELDRNEGALALPLIRNRKTVDPKDPNSTPVIQLESAMGAAVAAFPGALALLVGRDRFLPVKTTSDLLLMQSDVFELTDDYRLVARVPAPLIRLSDHYATVDELEARFPFGPPSLIEAKSFTINGDWTFGRDVRVVGDAVLPDLDEPGQVPDGAIVTAAESSEAIVLASLRWLAKHNYLREPQSPVRPTKAFKQRVS